MFVFYIVLNVFHKPVQSTYWSKEMSLKVFIRMTSPNKRLILSFCCKTKPFGVD